MEHVPESAIPQPVPASVPAAGAEALRLPPQVLGIGLLGYGSVGRAHINAYRKLSYIDWPPSVVPELRTLCGRDPRRLAEAASRYGFARTVTDWRELVEDPDIAVFDNSGPNNEHAAPCIAAALNGKHVLCEKPLARDAAEARTMLDAVRFSGVWSMVCFNYRFVPALTLAHQLIHSGRLGRVRHFRGFYLKGSGVDPEAPMRWRHRQEVAGLGTLGDLGSHTIDLARWLVGEIVAVSGLMRTFITTRPSGEADGVLERVTVDDAASALLQFGNGAIGTIVATRFAPGHQNAHTIEINCSGGSLSWNLERLNELRVYSTDGPLQADGFTDVLVTESHHPYYRFWWPPGHTIGWEHTFVHAIHHFLTAVAEARPVGPYGATFLDGYRNAVVADGILESSRQGEWVTLEYEM